MLLKDNQHNKPLYYAEYIGSTFIERIQVDPGSTLSIIPKRLLYFLSIPLSRLSIMTTTIYGFNAGSSHPLGKIRLRCQIGDLKSEVTYYIIELTCPTTFLLGWPWIHANWIVPSILHQCFKYVNDKEWSGRCSHKCSCSKGWRNTSLILYFIKRTIKW